MLFIALSWAPVLYPPRARYAREIYNDLIATDAELQYGWRDARTGDLAILEVECQNVREAVISRPRFAPTFEG